MGVPESAASEASSPNVSAKSFAIRDSRWSGFVALGLLILIIVLEVYEISAEQDTNPAVFTMLVLVLLVNGLLAVSRIRDFRGIRRQMADEHRKLEQELEAREQADEALEIRLESDRRDLEDNDWIEARAIPIRAQMAATIVPSEIADSLMEGLGRALDADFVVFYSFGKFENLKFARQWSQSTSTQIDVSQIPPHDSALLSLAKRLGNRSHVLVMEDSHQVDISSDPYPELLTASREVSRSWLMAPVGEAIHGMGYVWIGMVKDPRTWSIAEVGFVKRVVADATQLLAHAWMIGQSTQIADNEGKVNRLVELDRVKNDFIENMNHELRTPLTSIIGYLEVIMDDVDVESEPELVSSLVAVQRNALRLQILIENMMQISKTDFDILPLVASTVNVGQLLGDVVNSLKLGGDESGVAMTLRLDSPASDLIIDGDVNQLEQVFVNLMSNAIKFTPRGGTVTVSARRVLADGDYVEVQVADTGIGIPAKEFPNVFKRFFRASTATQASIPGFGIGLSLVHSIVREHHGTVTFDSTVGKGTVFTVAIPARYISAS